MVTTAKTEQSIFDRLTSWANLLAAAKNARRGKRRQYDVARFELERERELLKLQLELRTGAYRPGCYRAFYVREPKRRLISAAPYRDRVVHRALVNVIEPLFEKNFIFDSYANRVGKGAHRAVERYHEFAGRFRYVLQFDVVKYFPSIDHDILKGVLRSRIRDSEVLRLCDTIIDASNPQEPVTAYFPNDDLFTFMERRRGLPIGNLTSQFWANVYLHGLDNFVKRGLGMKGYIRYVDDFLIFGDDKERLIDVRGRVIEFLQGLRLRVHERRAQVRPTSRPSRFLGYRCWPDHRFLTKENIRRFCRYAHKLQHLYSEGAIDVDSLRMRITSWNAHASTANCYALRKRLLSSLKFQRGPVERPCPAGRFLEQQHSELPLGIPQQERA